MNPAISILLLLFVYESAMFGIKSSGAKVGMLLHERFALRKPIFSGIILKFSGIFMAVAQFYVFWQLLMLASVDFNGQGTLMIPDLYTAGKLLSGMIGLAFSSGVLTEYFRERKTEEADKSI